MALETRMWTSIGVIVTQLCPVFPDSQTSVLTLMIHALSGRFLDFTAFPEVNKNFQLHIELFGVLTLFTIL